MAKKIISFIVGMAAGFLSLLILIFIIGAFFGKTKINF
jgi:hypothetical protein